MLWIKKKKPKFVFSPRIKTKFNPETFGKKINRKWELLVEKYGEPEHDSRDGEPQINGYGVASFPNGSNWVIDAKTGEIIERTERVRYIGVSRGLHFYIHEDNDLLIGDSAKPSFPK